MKTSSFWKYWIVSRVNTLIIINPTYSTYAADEHQKETIVTYSLL